MLPFFFPDEFDWVAWNRSRVTAHLDEVEENISRCEMFGVEIEEITLDIKSKKKHK